MLLKDSGYRKAHGHPCTDKGSLKVPIYETTQLKLQKNGFHISNIRILVRGLIK